MVLLHLAAELPGPAFVLHLDHGLRDESPEDRLFVEAEAEKRGLLCRSERVELPSIWKKTGGSLEALARKARYEFFVETARKEDLSGLLLAHHRDDQIETIALELLRGGGPLALRGMLPQRKLSFDGDALLLRPLLPFARAQLEELALELGLSWREDASNRDLGPRRNRLRHLSLPAWRAKNLVDVDAQLLSLHRRAERLEVRTQALADTLIRPWLAKAELPLDGLSESRVSIPRETLRRLPKELLRVVLGKLGRALDAKFIDPSGRQVTLLLHHIAHGRLSMPLTPRLHLSLDDAADRLHLLARPDPAKLKAAKSWTPQLLREGEVTEIAETGERFRLTALRAGEPMPAPDLSVGERERQVFAMHSKLTLRRARWGERFHPFGWKESGHSKLVADAMAEASIPAPRRKMVAIVGAEKKGSNKGELLWIPGVRPAEGARCQTMEKRWLVERLSCK